MKLSIIIPSQGKRPQLLKQAIESAENVYTSKGESSREKNYDNEIIVVERDQSLGANVNRGFSMARGTWIKILADDDLVLPFMGDFTFQENHKVILGIAENENGGQGWPRFWRNRFSNFKEFVKKNNINGAGIIYHRSLLEDYPWSESLPFAEEREFHLRAFEHLKQEDFFHCDLILGIYRLGKQNKSRNADPEYRRKVIDEINRPWREKYL